MERSRRGSWPRDNGDGRSVAGRKDGRLSDRVRQHVYEKIVSGALLPGDLIQIGPLAEELGISRTPAREALLSLQASNLLSVVPNQGFVVTRISLADIRDIYMMRTLLEGATARRAATRLDDAARAELTRLHAEGRHAGGEGYSMTFDRSCYDFHRLIARHADSNRLLAGVDGIFDDYMRLQSVGVNPPDPALVLDDHQMVLDALLEADPVQAQEAMEQHIERLRKWALAALSD